MNGDKIIKIEAYPRIHVTLIGMNETGVRINGGFGFSIKQPSISFNITASEFLDICDTRQLPLDRLQLRRLSAKLINLKDQLNLKLNIKIDISGSLPTHSGFGSGTIFRLACIEGLLLTNNFYYTEADLIKMAGRGGTSGVGIRTYFNGGYEFDIGHKNLGQGLKPSSQKEVDTVQSLSISVGIMPDWKIGICFPIRQIEKNESEEQFFIINSNIPNEMIYKTLYHVVYEVLAGI